MNLYEEIEMQDLQRAVDSEASEVVRLREPIVPTKAQLEKVLIEVCKHTGRLVNCKDCANYEDERECKNYCRKNLEVVERTIFEWEKIRGTEPC